MKYLNFPKNQQTLFLKSIKSKTKYSWRRLAGVLNVNRSMLYFYLNESSKLSLDRYIKLCDLAKIRPKNIETIEIKNKQVTINIPSLSNLLAEFVGALAGDGHVNDVTYEVSISMDKDLDNQYSDHIIYLFTTLFNMTTRKFVQKNKVKCYVYSKSLVYYLSETFLIPIGKKKGKLHIPQQIKNNNTLLNSYIRGVFDTDGSFHRHHKNSAMLGFCSRDETFLKELQTALRKFKFNTYLNGKNLYIYRKDQIDKFFKEIAPSNQKHTSKYESYIKNGFVPLTKDILHR